MARWQPSRQDVVREYAAEVAGLFPYGRILVGLDGVETPVSGPEPADREAFADDLVVALHAQDVPAAPVRLGAYLAGDPFESGLDPAALVDLTLFRERVLTPFRTGEGAETAAGPFAPGDRGVLVVSGPFAHLGDLAGIWHTSAWLQVPRQEAYRREALRLGIAEDGPELVAWSGTVDDAFRRTDARKRSNATYDLTDPAHPRRDYEDAC